VAVQDRRNIKLSRKIGENSQVVVGKFLAVVGWFLAVIERRPIAGKPSDKYTIDDIVVRYM
jgi:hypothetical protein